MIKTYHAHIYFTLAQRALAAQVRERLAEAMPELSYLGQLIPTLVGPHPKPMFEIHIPASVLNEAIVKIEALREQLDVLIHPVHDDPLTAHTKEAKWLGQQQALNLAIFDPLYR